MSALLKGKKGYTIVEAVVAGALLVMGVAAAAVLANSLVYQQDTAVQAKIALNYQEQAGKLYHLGLDGSAITNILPKICSATNPPATNAIFLSFSNSTTNIANVGTMDRSVCTLVFPSHRGSTGTQRYRTNQVLLVRPGIR